MTVPDEILESARTIMAVFIERLVKKHTGKLADTDDFRTSLFRALDFFYQEGYGDGYEDAQPWGEGEDKPDKPV